jgi:hypothetical protein
MRQLIIANIQQSTVSQQSKVNRPKSFLTEVQLGVYLYSSSTTTVVRHCVLLYGSDACTWPDAPLPVCLLMRHVGCAGRPPAADLVMGLCAAICTRKYVLVL